MVEDERMPASMKRLVALEPGGPEGLAVVDVPVPELGPKDALIAIAASGVNFIDVYFRMGRYPSDRPILLGSEGLLRTGG